MHGSTMKCGHHLLSALPVTPDSSHTVSNACCTRSDITARLHSFPFWAKFCSCIYINLPCHSLDFGKPEWLLLLQISEHLLLFCAMTNQCTQSPHKLSLCYMFRHYRVILTQPAINTLPSYTGVSNAAVGNTVYNQDVPHRFYASSDIMVVEMSILSIV